MRLGVIRSEIGPQGDSHRAVSESLGPQDAALAKGVAFGVVGCAPPSVVAANAKVAIAGHWAKVVRPEDSFGFEVCDADQCYAAANLEGCAVAQKRPRPVPAAPNNERAVIL